MDFHCPSLKAILDLVVVSVGSNMVVTFQMLPYGRCSFEHGDLLRQRHSKRYCIILEPSSSCSLALPVYTAFKTIMRLCFNVMEGKKGFFSEARGWYFVSGLFKSVMSVSDTRTS